MADAGTELPTAAAPPAPPVVQLRVLGPPRLQAGGLPVPLKLRKAWGLLAYLALEGSATRSRLAGLLWSELDEAAARRNLRRELHRLREAGLGGLVLGDDVFVSLGRCRSDLAEFDAALREGRVAEAAALYRGRLLDGLDSGAALFDEWLQQARERLHGRWRDAARQAVQALQAQGRPQDALALQLRVLEVDALQEADFRTAMSLHAALGQREAALALYERCRATLGRELGLRPLPATAELAERIRRGESGVVGAPAPAARPAALLAADGGALVGRESDLAVLQALLAGPAPLLLLAGPAGIGKTRLLQALQAAVGGAPALAPQPGDAALPFAAACRDLRRRGLADGHLPAALRRPLAQLLPELAEPDTPAAQGLPAPLLHRALAGAWRALLPGGAPLFAVDDAHALDDDSLEALLALRQVPGAPPLVLALRDEELTAARLARLQTLAAQGEARWWRLAPLAPQAVAGWLRAHAGEAAERALAGALHQATAGHPLFVREALHELAERGWLRADGPRWRLAPGREAPPGALPVPAHIVDMLRARLQRRSDAERRLLDAVACAGSALPLEPLAEAGALSDDEAVAAAEALVESGLLVRDEAGGLGFGHELLREAALAALGPERRRLLHRRLARAAQATGRPPAQAAAHWDAGGQPGRAAPCWAEAAQQAEDLGARSAALALAERALPAAPPRLRVQLQLQRLRLLREAARPLEARAAAADADAAARRLGDLRLLARVQLERAAAAAVDAPQEAAAQVEAVLAQPRLPPLLRSRGLHLRAQLLRMRGDLAGSAVACREALAALPPGNWRSRGDIGVLLGLCAMFSGRSDEAQGSFAAAAEAAREAGADAVRVRALCGAASACADRGDMAGSRALCEQALAVARAVGLVAEQRTAILNLLRALVAQGELALARRHVDEGIALAPDFRDASEAQAFAEARYAVALQAGALGDALDALPVLQQSSRRCGEAYRAVSGLLAPLDLLLQLDPGGEEVAALLAEAGAKLGGGQLHDLDACHRVRRAWRALDDAPQADPGAARALLDDALADPALREQDRAWALCLRARAHRRAGAHQQAADDLADDLGAVNPEPGTLAWAERLLLAEAAGRAPMHEAPAAADWFERAQTPPLESLALALALLQPSAQAALGRRRARRLLALARRRAAALQASLDAQPRWQAAFAARFAALL